MPALSTLPGKVKRARIFTPSELSGELTERFGINRSTRWVMDKCARGEIKTLPGFAGRHLIPETELERLGNAGGGE